VRKAGGSLAEGEHEVPSYAHCDPCRLRSSASSSSPRAVAVRSKSVRRLVGNRNALCGMPSTVGWSSCSPQRSAVQRAILARLLQNARRCFTRAYVRGASFGCIPVSPAASLRPHRGWAICANGG